MRNLYKWFNSAGLTRPGAPRGAAALPSRRMGLGGFGGELGSPPCARENETGRSAAQETKLGVGACRERTPALSRCFLPLRPRPRRPHGCFWPPRGPRPPPVPVVLGGLGRCDPLPALSFAPWCFGWARTEIRGKAKALGSGCLPKASDAAGGSSAEAGGKEVSARQGIAGGRRLAWGAGSCLVQYGGVAELLGEGPNGNQPLTEFHHHGKKIPGKNLVYHRIGFF